MHHARGVLEVPELDRLYGDLNKLQALATQQINDEVLDARVHQALAVSQTRAWKQLVRK
jgi:hypothetical protein